MRGIVQLKALNPDERARVDFLRIFLVFLLVFLHFGAIYNSPVSSTVGFAGQDFAFAAILVSFVNFLGYTAVPTLSVISGFLFFQGANRVSPPDFRKLMRRRVASLALPFLLWSSAFVLLGYVLFRLDGESYAAIFAPEDGNLARSIGDAWLGLSDIPLAIQLWFIRDLIVTVAVSPVIWLVAGRAPVLMLGVLLVLWLGEHDLWIFLKLDVLGFFCLGAAIALNGWRRHVPDRLVASLALVFFLLVLGRAVAPAFLGNPEESRGLYIATCLMRIVGVVAIWSAAPFLMRGLAQVMTVRFSGMPFFLHCAHYPPILLVKSVFGGLLGPQSDVMHLVVYFGTVLATLIGTVTAAGLLRGIAPGVFSLLSGGRGGSTVVRNPSRAAG